MLRAVASSDEICGCLGDKSWKLCRKLCDLPEFVRKGWPAKRPS